MVTKHYSKQTKIIAFMELTLQLWAKEGRQKISDTN